MRPPMFSERTRWDLRPNRLAERLAAKRAAGVPVIDLAETNPTRAGLPYPSDLLLPLSAPEALRYEPSPFGLEAAPGAVPVEEADQQRNREIVAPDSGASLHFTPGPGSYPVYGYFIGDEMTGIYIDFESSIAKI